jgi:hypothetical protein
LREYEAIRNEEIKSMSTPTSSNNMSTAAPSSVRIQIGRQPNVTDQGRKAEPANAASVSADRGITPVSSQVEVGPIKPVDRRTIEGSYDGQTDKGQFAPKSANFSTDFAKNSPAPRQGMTQSKVMSSKLDYPLPAVSVTDLTEPNSEVE